jgi:hypothetical protein
MAAALAELGYAADYVQPEPDTRLFRAKISACLRSHLPVILTTVGPRGAHAVTLTGYSEPSEVVDVGEGPGEIDGLPMRTGTLRTVYVHDDNLGSHAHYELLDSPPAEHAQSTEDLLERISYGGQGLWLLRGRTARESPTWWKEDCCLIESALIPKPSKVRMSLEELFAVGRALRTTIELALPDQELWFDLAFDTGVEYRQRMFSWPLDKRALMDFNNRCCLPRHLAVISTHRGDAHICDVLLDATKIDLSPDAGSLLGIVAPGVPLRSQAWRNLSDLGDGVRIPMIAAPPNRTASKPDRSRRPRASR